MLDINIIINIITFYRDYYKWKLMASQVNSNEDKWRPL